MVTKIEIPCAFGLLGALWRVAAVGLGGANSNVNRALARPGDDDFIFQ
jgi:hypothetical protein